MKQIFVIILLLLGSMTTYSFAQMGHGMMRYMEKGMGGRMMGSSSESTDNAKQSFSSNGERIYYTGISEQTGVIPLKGGPMWLSVHGGSCANCHGTTGKGGVPVMMGTATPTDIRYKKLTVEEHDHGGVKEKHKRYTDELIKRAITQGLNSDGKPLDPTMPRYSMTEEDMDDLIKYLKTLE